MEREAMTWEEEMLMIVPSNALLVALWRIDGVIPL